KLIKLLCSKNTTYQCWQNGPATCRGAAPGGMLKSDCRKRSINLLVGPHRLSSLLQDLLRLVVAQDTVLHRLVIVRLQLRVLRHRLSRPLDQGGAGLLEGEPLVQRPTHEGEQGQEREDRPRDQECSPTHRNTSKPLAGRRRPCRLLGRGQRVPQLGLVLVAQ